MAKGQFCIGENNTCGRLVVEENETKCSLHRGGSFEMVETLRKYGPNHGFARLAASTAVVVIGPGTPFTAYATPYRSAALQEAIDSGLLEARKLNGAVELEFYTPR